MEDSTQSRSERFDASRIKVLSDSVQARVLGEYARQLTDTVAEIRAVSSGDQGHALAARAHLLKGSALEFGANTLSELCLALEEQTQAKETRETNRAETPHSTAALVVALEQEAGLVRAEVERYLAALG